LEEAITDIRHDLLVFADFGRNTYENAKFGRKIDALLFLFNLKQRLVGISDFLLIVFHKIVKHLDLSLWASLLSLFEIVRSRSHIPANPVYFISTFLTIIGHHDCIVKVTIHGILIF